MDVNAWQEIKKFTGIVRLSNPHIVWIWGGYGITNALSPFITLYYSAEILNQLIKRIYSCIANGTSHVHRGTDLLPAGKGVL